jgi:hypothetical protein
VVRLPAHDTTDGQPPGTAGKVPVERTAIDSYRFVFANLDRFVVLACVPVLIVFGTELAVHLIHSSLAGWMFTLVSLGAWTVFVVRWHRLVLLDDRGGAFKALLTIRNLRVFAYVLVVFLVWVFAFPIILRTGFSLSEFLAPTPAATDDFPATNLEGTGRPLTTSKMWLVAILTLTAMTIWGFLALRFSLVLPGAAVDRPLRLVDAWRQLRGNSWRYIGTTIVGVVLPYDAVDFLVSLYWSGLTTSTIQVLGTEWSSEVRTPIDLENGIFAFSMTVIGALVVAVGITVLSKFYRHIVGGETGEGGVAAGPA